MAAVPITVPGVGESISEGILSRWLKPDGSLVKAGEPLFELETDKATSEVPATTSGVLKISVGEGQTVEIGASVGTIDPAATPAPVPAPAAAPASAAGTARPASAASQPGTPMTAQAGTQTSAPSAPSPADNGGGTSLSPAVRRLIAENDVDPAKVSTSGPGGRLTKGDVLAYLQDSSPTSKRDPEPPPAPAATTDLASAPTTPVPHAPAPAAASRDRETRERMSGLRQRIAQRLVEAQQTAAILTTFNEADMSRVTDLRTRYKELFKTQHGVALGFMSFFVKASAVALEAFPVVNARIEGNEIVSHNYINIGVAVSTDRGLMVPVLRDAGAMSFAEIEKAIAGYADKARKGAITVDDLRGGTFTITNGGIFGSLLSTPILNPPQSAILGMHAIKKRPVVENDQIVIRPMMYLALSYDHRLIDGREAVSFLVRIKDLIENPDRMMLAT
jgi:2-oxoglutarate dehydrogenase E2 component (dihydrolipoamide succinyltransferase)